MPAANESPKKGKSHGLLRSHVRSIFAAEILRREGASNSRALAVRAMFRAQFFIFVDEISRGVNFEKTKYKRRKIDSSAKVATE